VPTDKNKPQFKVGDRIQISLNNRIVEAVIRAVIEESSGFRLQVDFGNEQTALIQRCKMVGLGNPKKLIDENRRRSL